jgi:hypothetical protein
MSKFAFLLLSAFSLNASAVAAQGNTTGNEIVTDCVGGDCVDLPPVEAATNFLPGIAPALLVSGFVLSVGGGGTTSTNSTTATTE